MAEEMKDHVKLETRQSFLKEKQRNLESHREILQDMCKEIVETRVVHLAEVDQKIQSLETQLAGLQELRKEVEKTREGHLAELNQRIQSITEEINACRNELLEIADLQVELQATTKE